jgi:hypothetical protein
VRNSGSLIDTLHLGPSDRDEELSFRTFDKCTDSRGCGAQGGPADTVDHCEDYTVRLTGSGFSPCSTGTRLRRFKTLWLRLRGDRTGMRAVLGDRVLQHPWSGLLKVQAFRAVWQQDTATKFMGHLREEGFPDLALAGEELLQAEPRGLLTWTTGTRGRSHLGLQSSFWSSMGIGDRMDGPLDAGWNVGTARDPHRVWLSRLEEWKWWLDVAARMTKRIDIPQPSIVTWNIGPIHWLFNREWIRKTEETVAPLLMFQEVRLPPGSHRTVKWCLSQMCPGYDIWMEEGHETKDPLKERRDHGFDCGLDLAVITMTHRRVFDASKTKEIEWMQGSQQRTLEHMAWGRILMLGLVSHSGEAFRCINMHQSGYSDTTRRERIVENLTKIILDNKSLRYIIGGNMNASSPGGRDGYSQNPATVQLRKTTDETLTSFSQRIGDTLVSPNVPTWRRGDGTKSATLDHVILVNFPDKTIRVTAEALGDIQYDHLCLKLGLDSTVLGDRAPEGPLNTSTGPRLEAKTWSKVRKRVDESTEVQSGHGNETAERCDRGKRSGGAGVPKQAGDSFSDTDGGTAASHHKRGSEGTSQG